MLRTQRTYLAPGWEEALRAADLYSVEAIFALTAGTIVRTSGSSEVRRIKAPSSSGPEFLFLKKYWVTRWAQLRSRVFRGMLFGESMVEREFRNLSRLCEWGLSRAYPVAFGEERRWGWLWRSFLITAGIPEPTGLDTFIRDQLPLLPIAEKHRATRDLLMETARLVGAMHARNFLHRDLFWRNLVIANNALAQLSVIDAPRGRLLVRPLSVAERAADLACLDAAAPYYFSRPQRLRFFLAYRQQRRLDAAGKELLQTALAAAAPQRSRQLDHVHVAQ